MHQTAILAEHDPATDEISFSILEVAGVFRGEYLIKIGDDLKTVGEIDNENTTQAVRLLWEGESVTEDHLEQLKTDLFYRTVSLA